MKQFLEHYVKPMRWYWMLIGIVCCSLFTMNYFGYRLFSTNQKTWSQDGPGGHK